MKITKLINFIVCIIFVFSLSLQGKETTRLNVYEKIQKNNTIVIGISRDYPPLNFEAGKRGVDINLAKKLGEFLSVRVEPVPLNVSQYIPSIENGKVDIVIAGLSRDLMRAKRIWFSVPYISVTPAVLAYKRALPQRRYGDDSEQSPVQTIWDLQNLARFVMAVKKGSTNEAIIKEYFPNIQQVSVTTNQQGMDLLMQAKVQGFVHDSLYFQYIYNNNAILRNNYVLLQGGGRIEQLCIGLPFGDTILKNQIDIFILEMQRQGFIDSWLKEYNIK